MNNSNRKHFKFYLEYKKLFNMLSVWQVKKLIFALIDYVETGALPELKPKPLMVFNAIKPIIDGDIEYERIRQERIKAGKKSYQNRQKKAKSEQKSNKIQQKSNKNTTLA